VRSPIGSIALAAAMICAATSAQAFDETKYPDWSGQWRRPPGVGNQWDTSKPPRQGQAPLTPEYQAIYEANLSDMIKGGQGIDPTYACVSPGMPRVMIVYGSMEVLVTPDTTYILLTRDHDFYRRIYTDGRNFPTDMEEQPKFLGYSIGKWLDEDGAGRYHTLEVETRGMKGPRVFDATGIPLHADNQTIVKERIYLDKANPNLLHDDITTIDHALTRPWVVNKTFRRVQTDKPIWWAHEVCGEGNAHVGIGNEVYYLSADGLLMPAKKDQPPPDLRYFKQTNR
jgi:hypothetical protein